MRVNPPAPAITGDVYLMTLRFQTLAGIIENTQHFMGSVFSTNPNNDINAVLSALVTLYPPAFLLVMSSGVTVVDLSVAIVSRSDIATQTAVLNQPTTATNAPLPQMMQASILFNSTLKGQHGRGRMMIGSLPIIFTTPGTNPNVLNSGGLAALNGLGATLATPSIPLTTGFALPVIATRPVKPATLVSKAMTIDFVQARAQLGTQRRRQPGRGI